MKSEATVDARNTFNSEFNDNYNSREKFNIMELKS